MALQFSSSIKTLYAGLGLNNHSSNGYGIFNPSGRTISIHSGTQPSASAILQNWTWHRQASSASESQRTHLATYTDCGWTINGPSITMTKFPNSVIPNRNGTASWAILWATEMGNNMTSNTAPGYPFIVVPVTTTAGDGVIRFTSLDFTTTSPVIMIDAGLTII